MGDPARADKSQIVDYPYHDQPGKWPHRKAMFQIKANYMLMIDNLMDLTHLGYVHNRTIGGDPNTHVTADMETRPTENGAYFIRWLPDCQPPPTYQKGGQVRGAHRPVAGVRIRRAGHRVAMVGRSRRRTRRAREPQPERLPPALAARRDTGDRDDVPLFLVDIANGYRQEEPQATQEMYDEIYPTFIEDKTIMEAQQERLDLDPDRSLVPINADGALALARIAIDRLIAQEQATVAQAAE